MDKSSRQYSRPNCPCAKCNKMRKAVNPQTEDSGGGLPTGGAGAVAGAGLAACPAAITSLLGGGGCLSVVPIGLGVVPTATGSSGNSDSGATKVGGLRFGGDSDNSNDSRPEGILFANENTIIAQERESSVMSGDSELRPSRPAPAVSACHAGWNKQPSQSAGPRGRDTLGFAFHLGTATLGHTRCSLGTACDEDCGYGTGCDAGCAEAQELAMGSISGPHTATGAMDVVTGYGQGIAGIKGGVPGAAPRAAPGAAPGGAMCGSGGGWGKGPGRPGGASCSDGSRTDQLSFFITFLLEVLGVLVFFAICTMTFWITLGYHVVQLLLELKNADRNVQVAVGIVCGVLLLAFALSLVTNSSGSCCHAKDRARARARSGCPFARHKAKRKAKTKCCPHKARSSPPKRRTASLGGGGCRLEQRRYSDCEGRAIFINSRRYAIPTEMKQPPTILLWLRDVLGRMMQ